MNINKKGILDTNDISEVEIVNGIQLWCALSEDGSDRSGNEYHGINHGATQEDDENNANSLYFNGTSDYIDFGNVLNMGTDDLTITAWVKTDDLGKSAYIASKARAAAQNHRYAVRLFDGRISVFMQGDGGSDVSVHGQTFVADSQWHFVSWVFNRNGQVEMFVDGIKDPVSPSISHWSHVNMTSNNPFRIASYTGSNNTSPMSMFRGNIWDFRLFNRSLTAEEIGILYDLTGGSDEKMKITKNTVYVKGQVKEVSNG